MCSNGIVAGFLPLHICGYQKSTNMERAKQTGSAKQQPVVGDGFRQFKRICKSGDAQQRKFFETYRGAIEAKDLEIGELKKELKEARAANDKGTYKLTEQIARQNAEIAAYENRIKQLTEQLATATGEPVKESADTKKKTTKKAKK